VIQPRESTIPSAPSVISLRSSAEPAELRLFCFPPAGGAASPFRDWRHRLPPTVELRLLELPGHGSRLLEPPIDDFGELVAATTAALAPHVSIPYVLFGHSLGGLLAFEVTGRLRLQRLPPPVHVFIGCCGAPHVAPAIPELHRLPAEELRLELRRLGGTPEEILVNDDLWELLEPATRADLSFAATYDPPPRTPPLPCRITAFGGRLDAFVTVDDLADWEPYSGGEFESHVIDGGHFAIHENADEFFELFHPELVRCLDRIRAAAPA
jgi:medium-chain acyl-[acyl-carrier-protein] hydrolase